MSDPRYNHRYRVIPIPRRMPVLSVDTPFVPPVRLPLTSPFPPAPAYLPHTCTPLGPLLATPWSQPFTIPVVHPAPGNTPIWPSYTPLPPLAIPPGPPIFWEPGTFPAEPFGTPVPLRLHPHLIYNPMDPLIPILQWDIIHRAEQARVLTGRQVIVPVDLSVQAVLPSAPKIWISTDHPYLAVWMESWGPIIVEKPNIVIRDVLDAIWEYFQKPLTNQEFQRIRDSPHGLAHLTYSAQQRVKDAFELYPVGLACGFKRVDVLGGHRRFQGIRPVVYENMTWKVFLGLMPGPVPHVV